MRTSARNTSVTPNCVLASASIIAALVALVAHPVQAATATIDTTKTYQTIEGLGGATAFYAGWIPAHPYQQEIYTNAFASLNLSMLRLGDWYRYQTPLAGFDSAATAIVSNANRVLGHPVPVFMSSWAPPAFLKSNGQTGNGGTLLYTNGSFAYTNFAQYWHDSINAYQSNGVSLTWMSIQNEPDWAASYDSCVFYPSEQTVNGTNYASYSKALDANFQRLTNLPSPPKLLAPECVGIGYNDVQNYAATMNSNSFYGVTHHLYGGSTDGSPDGYTANLTALTNVFPGKPHFMTEFGYPDMINTACLIHNCLTVEQDAGFNYWSLVWPFPGDALVQIENPYNLSSWTNAPPGVTTQSHGWWLTPAYWAMKHFSYFIQPGYRRVSASDDDSNVRSSAYLSPDGLRLVVVLINTNTTTSSTMAFNFGIFNAGKSSVYQTAGTNTYAGTNTFLPLGSLTNSLVLPSLSLTTVVLDQTVPVGQASNPSPTNGAIGVALGSSLCWTPGSNAVAHAVYLGVDSNAVASATTASPQFLGVVTATIFYPPLAGGTTYFWRVDETVGANTNVSTVWSFSTVPVPSLIHRYSFSETGGTNTADSVGGPAWSGMLPNGGTFAGGQLTLSSNAQQYVSLPSGIISTSATSAVTIEAWASFATNLPWASWFFGFGNIDGGGSGGNYLFCSEGGGRFAITGVDPGYLRETNAYTTGLNWSGKTLHLACVVDPTSGYIAIYTNGALAGTNKLGTYSLSSINNKYSFINRSLYANDPYVNLTINEFRIYSRALGSAEIAATDALGPDQVLNPNSPVVGMAVTGANLTLSWPLASAGFALQSRTNLTLGNWVTVSSPAPQIVGTNYQIALPVTNAIQFFRLSK